MDRLKDDGASWKKKRSHQGTACRRGQPVYYDETKRAINLMLTPTAIDILTQIAQEMGQSRSEVIEVALRCSSIQQAIRAELQRKFPNGEE